jgi:Phage tail tube protein
MARAYGSSAHLLMKRETAYGQAATGNYVRMPFNRCNLGSEQNLIDDPVLGQGRDPLAPLQDVINDEGDIVLPVDPRYLGLWLTGLFGDPDTTDNLDGSWDHEFASGGDDMPSYTVEVGMPKVPAFFRHSGVKLNSIALELTRSGPAAATINAIAQGETRFGTSQGGTPTSLTFSRVSQFQGSIKRAGNPVACQGQLRLAPSGHVVGIDISGVLKPGVPRGCDLAVLSELLPAPRPVWSRRFVSARIGLVGSMGVGAKDSGKPSCGYATT